MPRQVASVSCFETLARWRSLAETRKKKQEKRKRKKEKGKRKKEKGKRKKEKERK